MVKNTAQQYISGYLLAVFQEVFTHEGYQKYWDLFVTIDAQSDGTKYSWAHEFEGMSLYNLYSLKTHAQIQRGGGQWGSGFPL